MSEERGAGLDGPLRLTSRDIMAWSELTGTVIRPDEVAIIKQMDAAYMRASSAERAEAAARQRAETQGGK